MAGSHDATTGRDACSQRDGKLVAGSRPASARVHEVSCFELKYHSLWVLDRVRPQADRGERQLRESPISDVQALVR
jgi:hypothetical protein